MATDLDVEVVGREFVRQYYTVLNQRPDCLHQFFTKDSSFVHGGVERPGEEQPACQGQAVIHQKILSLNFRDCHTKIRQVDCQKTVGNAVLVQVSGELSNNGEPMRKFMQSFVLVQQAPKNFYVHNDIFRYQDEVFHDYHYPPPPSVVTDSVPIDNAAKAYMNHEVSISAGDVQENEVAEPRQTAAVVGESVANGSYGSAKEQQQSLTGVQPSVAPVTSINSEPNNLNGSCQEVTQTMQTIQQETPGKKVEVEQVKVEEVALENGEGKEAVEKTVAVPMQPQQQKSFSWASMASRNASSSLSTTTATPQSKPQAAIKPERKSETAATSQTSSPPAGSTAPVGSSPRQQVQAQPRTSGTSDRKWSPSEGEEGLRPAPVFVPDNQQLFIGNLPHNIHETDIKELFEKYGNVIDIKINRKGAARELPNFGFVAFDSHEAVGRAMKSRPIMLHGRRRINIEEKKDQSSVGAAPRRVPSRGGRGGMRGGARTTTWVNGGSGTGQTMAEAEE